MAKRRPALRPIDAHVHVGRWSVPEFSGKASTVQEAVQVYSKWNWAGAILFPTDEGLNEQLLLEASAVDGPIALRVGYWADFQRDGNLGSFEKRAADYAVLKIHPSCVRAPATDDRFRPYCEIAATLALPIVIHCGRWQEMAGYRLALAVAKEYKTCPVILAHMGGDSPHLVRGAMEAIVEDGLDNAYLGTESIREPWLLEAALSRLGSTRLIFGSDYNLNHPEPFRRMIEILDISDKQRENILGVNINGLLGEPHRFF